MSVEREGEISLADDPAAMPADGHIVFIGHLRTPWKTREDCPKNMVAARATGEPATLQLAAPFRAGLASLTGTSHIIILTWMHNAPRNLIVQKPRHAVEPKGVFSLRSPARPNPVGLDVARLIEIDVEAGLLTLDASDMLDGTPVIDIKPYFASIDAFPDAMPPRRIGAP